MKDGAPDPAAARRVFLALRDAVCAELEAADGGARFAEDLWDRAEGGGGSTRILSEGAVFEKAGVGFSHVRGQALPDSATALRPELGGMPWEALGVSIVVHPRNPYVPTSHMNVRFVSVDLGGPPSLGESELRRASPPGGRTWWFGGGFDLTPFYGFEEDAVFWHRTAREAVAPFGEALYPRFKRTCDDYFFLKHRGEARGIGGLFFDDFNELGFDKGLALAESVGRGYLRAYRPIVARRKGTPFRERERRFQLYRRGRYVEFNLVADRGTLFGLQSGGRSESILMSLPPLARWDYGWSPEPGSPEARLYEVFLKPRNWADFSIQSTK